MGRRRDRRQGSGGRGQEPAGSELLSVTLEPTEWLRYAGAVLSAADLLTSREQKLKTWSYRAASKITEAVRHPDRVEGCRQLPDGEMQLTRAASVWSQLQSLTVRTAGVVGSAVAQQLSQQNAATH
jgi:hypothetical protein